MNCFWWMAIIVGISGTIIKRRIVNESISAIVGLITDFLSEVCFVIYLILVLFFYDIQKWQIIAIGIGLVAMGWICGGYWSKLVKSYKMYKELKI